MAHPKLRIRLLLSLVLLGALGTARAQGAGEDADYRRAHQLYVLQEYQLAAGSLAKFLAAHPDSPRAGQARLLLAESHYRLKSYAQAARQFARFLKDAPDSPKRPQALQRAVKAHYLAKQYAPGIRYADIFLKEFRSLLGRPQAPPALPALFESVLYYAGESGYALKQYAQARKFWTALQRDFPNSKLIPDAAEGLGWIAFEEQRYEEAARQFARTAAAPKHPKAASSQLMLARSRAALKQTGAALLALDKVAGKTGGKAQASHAAYWRAKFLLDAKRYAPGLAALRALLKQFPQYPAAPSTAAEAAWRAFDEGRHDEARQLAALYLASFARGPKAPARSAMARLEARVLAEQKKSDEARGAAQRALEEAEALPGKKPATQEERAASLMLLAGLSGPAGEALYERLLREYPGSRLANLARYRLALAARRKGRLARALSRLEAILKPPPPSAGAKTPEARALRKKALFVAGTAAYDAKQYARAEAWFKTYAALPEVKADPTAAQLPFVQLRLAWCRHHAKDPDAAIALLERGLAGPAKGAVRREMLYLRGASHLEKSGGALDGKAPLARKDVQKQEREAALADYARLVKEAPNEELAARACWEAASHLMGLGQAARALPWLDKVAENPAFAAWPMRADVLLLRGEARFRLGRYAGALADAEALLKRGGLQSKAPAVRLLKALALEELPDKEREAEAAYTALIEAGPAEAPPVRQGLLNRGRLRFRAKRYAEAGADLAAYLGKQPVAAGEAKRLDAAVLLAACRKENHDRTGAKKLLEELARLKLTGLAAFEVPFQLGYLAYDKERFNEAAAQYEKALAAAKDLKDLPRKARVEAWRYLAWSRMLEKKTQKAEAAFGRLLALDPQGPYAAEALYQRGRLLSGSGELEGALSAWKALLAKHAQDPLAEKALAALAAAQAQAGRFAEAQKNFELYLARYPSKPAARDAWCGLAECRLQTKDPKGARAAFLKALGGKKPGLEGGGELDAAGERAALGLAELALAQGDAATCKKGALRIVIDRPASKWLDTALYLCGKASEELAEPQRAIAYYRKLLKERPKSERAGTARERLKALGAPP